MEGRRRHILEELLGGFSDKRQPVRNGGGFFETLFLVDTPEIGEDDPKKNTTYVFGSGLKAPTFVETLLIIHWWYLHMTYFSNEIQSIVSFVMSSKHVEAATSKLQAMKWSLCRGSTS